MPSSGPTPSRRRATLARGRRVLWGALAVFVALNLGLGLAMNHRPAGLRDPAYARRARQFLQRVKSAGPGARSVLFLGSSRLQFGLRAGLLDAPLAGALGRPVVAYNFGKAASGARMNLLTWERLRRDGARPDLLVVEVLAPLLSASGTEMEMHETLLPTTVLAWEEIALVERCAGPQRPGLRREWLTQSLVPCYYHRTALVRALAAPLLPFADRAPFFPPADDSGDLNLVAANSECTRARRAAATEHGRREYHRQLTSFRLGAAPCAALEELLRSCRSSGVAVVLLLMPEGPAFQRSYPPGAWVAIEAYLARASREHGARLASARDWHPDEEDYLDSHHLLRPAAEKFTARLGREVVLPALRALSLREEASRGR